MATLKRLVPHIHTLRVLRVSRRRHFHVPLPTHPVHPVPSIPVEEDRRHRGSVPEPSR